MTISPARHNSKELKYEGSYVCFIVLFFISSVVQVIYANGVNVYIPVACRRDLSINFAVMNINHNYWTKGWVVVPTQQLLILQFDTWVAAFTDNEECVVFLADVHELLPKGGSILIQKTATLLMQGTSWADKPDCLMSQGPPFECVYVCVHKCVSICVCV